MGVGDVRVAVFDPSLDALVVPSRENVLKDGVVAVFAVELQVLMDYAASTAHLTCHRDSNKILTGSVSWTSRKASIYVRPGRSHAHDAASERYHHVLVCFIQVTEIHSPMRFLCEAQTRSSVDCLPEHERQQGIAID